ncbi:MAG: V-type ATPase subunit [Deltaproteobacteria bacterium]|nr:V-type ATPase subunit [Deltaproteobacteria bacterium]
MTGRVDWSALGARARGLGTRLFHRAELEELAGLGEIPALARALARSGRTSAPIAEGLDVEQIETIIRRTAARALHTLAMWSEAHPAVLEVFFADQDRRILRAMLRGAVEGAPAQARQRGLLATPRIPERALVELAHAATPKDVTAELVLLSHPDATRLIPLTARAQTDLFEVEAELARAYAERVTLAARSGDSNLRRFVRERIDLINAENALLLAGSPRDLEAASSFVQGGRWLSLTAFARVAGAGSRPVAARLLAEALARSPFEALVSAAHESPVALERQALLGALAGQRRASRLDPLGSAPALVFLLRLEAQTLDLLHIAWGAALSAPASWVKEGLVTPWS